MSPGRPPRGLVVRAVCLVLGLACALPAHGTMPMIDFPRPLGENGRVLCTVFPVYALTRELLANTPIQADLLLPASLGCPHSYSLTPTDLQKIAAADRLICLGLGFEPFLERVGKEYALPIFRSAEGFPGLFNGATTHNDHDIHDEHHHNHDHGQPNVHLFTIPAGMRYLAERIAGHLQEASPAHRDIIGANADRFLATLADLETTWKEARQRGEGTPVLLAQDSLDYIARDLGLRVVGRVGGGEGASLSAGEMVALTGVIREERPVAIVVDAQERVPAAETLARETGLPLVALDTLALGPDPLPEGYLAATLRTTLDRLQKFFPTVAPTSGPDRPR